MKLKVLLLFLIICIIFDAPLFAAQKGKSINSRQKELKQLNSSIKNTRNKINSLSKKERSTINELNINQKHSLELNKYVNLLDEEIAELHGDIYLHDSIYYGLSEKLRLMISSYAALARKTYLEGKLTDEEMIFTDRSYNEEIRQEVYREKLTELFKENMKKINLMRVAVSNQAGILKNKNDYYTELKDTKKREQGYLDYTIKKNKRLLNKIKKDKTLTKKQLKQKQRSAAKLKSIISELIRKEAAKDKSTGVKSLGVYQWPTSSKKIFRDFGKVKSKETNTYFDNPGIDISSKVGSSVKCVDNGEVSMINWLPGYGTIVIINHGGGFRSVYANLSSIKLKKGDRVKTGQVIGRTGESVEGAFLHFELWKGSKRLNPRRYLK